VSEKFEKDFTRVLKRNKTFRKRGGDPAKCYKVVC